MDPIVIFVAKYFIAIPVVVLAVHLFRLKPNERWPFVFLLVGSGVLAFVLARLGSQLYYDTRPFVQGGFTPLVSHAADNGFPSDHTLLAAWMACAVWPYWRKASYALLGVALLVGLSRMAAGVHHSWDILGSFAFAALGVYVGHLILSKMTRQPKATPTIES